MGYIVGSVVGGVTLSLETHGEPTIRERVSTKRLPLLTNSSMTMFRRCPREYQFAYVIRRRSKNKAEALRFGSFFHAGLNAWWRTDGSAVDKLTAGLTAMQDRANQPGEGDAFELVKAEELLLGYTARWGHSDLKTLAVELQFRLPLSTGYDLGGAIDAIAQSKMQVSRGEPSVHNVEHKTTSQDISSGAPYWSHVHALDTQVSTYMHAARELGYAPRDTIYDAIRKPSILPLKATPEESKKYTKPTRAEPVPRLYANMRETDETPDEYRGRLRTDIASNPDRYFQRQTIVRLEADDSAHADDTTHTAEMIRFAESRNAWPRTPGACLRYGRMCDYHDVCSGNASIDDSRFETKENTHDELGDR